MKEITRQILMDLHAAQIDIAVAEAGFVAQMDLKQYSKAGVELGRLEELANRVVGLCKTLNTALWDEEHAQ